VQEQPENEGDKSDLSLEEEMPQVFVLRVTANGRLFRCGIKRNSRRTSWDIGVEASRCPLAVKAGHDRRGRAVVRLR
jgi:hypothetical protein